MIDHEQDTKKVHIPKGVSPENYAKIEAVILLGVKNQANDNRILLDITNKAYEVGVPLTKVIPIRTCVLDYHGIALNKESVKDKIRGAIARMVDTGILQVGLDIPKEDLSKIVATIKKMVGKESTPTLIKNGIQESLGITLKEKKETTKRARGAKLPKTYIKFSTWFKDTTNYSKDAFITFLKEEIPGRNSTKEKYCRLFPLLLSIKFNIVLNPDDPAINFSNKEITDIFT